MTDEQCDLKYTDSELNWFDEGWQKDDKLQQ